MTCSAVNFTFTFTAVCDGLCTGDWCFVRGRNEVLQCNLDECEALYLIGRTDKDEAWERRNRVMLHFEINSSLCLLSRLT